MENIRVDRESGQVILLQVLNEARPGLHRQGTSRILRRVLEKYDGTPITKMRVNSVGNPNIVGTLEACVYLLDNIPGVEWDKWRQESAYEFKKALIEHVERKKSSTTDSIVTSPMTPSTNSSMDVQSRSESEDEVTESDDEVTESEDEPSLGKSKIRESSVRDKLAEFHHGSIEVWTPSGVIDVLTEEEVIEVKYYRNWQRGMGQVLAYGSHYPERVKRLHLFAHNGDNRVDQFVSQAKSVCVEYGVQVTLQSPFVDTRKRRLEGEVPHLVQLWNILNQRHPDAGFENDQMAEFVKLSKHLNNRFNICGELPSKANHDVNDMPFWFEHASAEEKRAYVSSQVKKSILKMEIGITASKKSILEMEIGMITSCKKALEMIRPLDESDKTELIQWINNGFRRAYGSQFVPPTETSIEASTVTSSETSSDSHAQLQVCNTIDTSTGLPLATPKCSLSVRGSETSIPLEAAKLHVRVGERSGLVGRETRKLYGIRYGQEASRNIPKRSTIFRGKPWSENVYFSRDSDLVQRAIRNICGC